jgi:hypothetical protein
VGGEDVANENDQNERQNVKNSESNPPSKQDTGPGYFGITDRGTLVLLATARSQGWILATGKNRPLEFLIVCCIRGRSKVRQDALQHSLFTSPLCIADFSDPLMTALGLLEMRQGVVYFSVPELPVASWRFGYYNHAPETRRVSESNEMNARVDNVIVDIVQLV